MTRFADVWNTITTRIINAPRTMPSAVEIPINQVQAPKPAPKPPAPTPVPPISQPGSGKRPIDDIKIGQPSPAPFAADEDYFQVRVNELYLTNSRQWFSAVDPVVFVVSEFIYDKAEQAIPFVVGPGLIEQQKLVAPPGTILRDTRVSGLHPFRGGRLNLSVVLCSVQVKDYARRLLGVIEKASGPLGLASSLGSYLHLADVVLDGFEGLVGLEVTTPLVGLRREFDSAAGDAFAPGFYALINAPDVDPQMLWVRDNQLYHGKTAESSAKFTAADFVLFSVVRPPDDRRDDLSTLPFYPLWERVRSEANSANGDKWSSAKANMLSLYETIELSPDLSTPQRDELKEFYKDRMKAIHEKALELANLGTTTKVEPSPLDAVRPSALSILEM